MIELITFRLRDGVDDAAFVAADATAQQGFYYLQPGLARRTTARSVDTAGEWLCIVVWFTAENAEAAADAAHDHPDTKAAFALIDPASFDVRRFEPLAG